MSEENKQPGSAQAREQVLSGADKLLSIHPATQAKGWELFTQALDIYERAIRREEQEKFERIDRENPLILRLRALQSVIIEHVEHQTAHCGEDMGGVEPGVLQCRRPKGHTGLHSCDPAP